MMVKNKFHREEIKVLFPAESRTQQHFREQTDINKIMSKAEKTGMIPVNRMNPKYGDFSDGRTYHESMVRISEIEQEFDKMPAEIKKRFSQNPAEIIDFLSKEENREEAIELGLIEKEKKVSLKEKGNSEQSEQLEGSTPGNTCS